MIRFPELSIRRRSLLPLAVGLTVAQIIGTLFVWQSNQNLSQTAQALEAAGWLAIPAGPAAATLKDFGAAFCGGFFFTLSIGVGLALATWAALFFWAWLSGLRRSGHRRVAMLARALSIAWLAVALALWLLAIYLMNARGPSLFQTLFIVGIPMGTAAAAIRRGPTEAGRLWLVPILVLMLLTGMWYKALHPLDEQLFIAIRDRLLLSNPVGMAVNDFYYRYTLYAAQTFKSFAQKEARACRISNMPDDESIRRLSAVLAKYDVLTLPDNAQPVDLVITTANGLLRLTDPHGKLLEVKPREFIGDPRHWLRRFSQVSDRYETFRRLTFLGLLLGFPILLYVLVDGAVGRLAHLFIHEPTLTWVRAAVCFVIGILLLVPIWAGKPAGIQKAQIGPGLAAEAWPQRVAALRLIEKEKIEITDYPQYRHLLESHRLADRYYLARALGVSRSPESFDDLLAMIHDPHPNVVCQAYYALGERNDRRAVGAIQTQILKSDHWYAQWYGYRAMKRLGWRQTHSKSAP